MANSKSKSPATTTIQFVIAFGSSGEWHIHGAPKEGRGTDASHAVDLREQASYDAGFDVVGYQYYTMTVCSPNIDNVTFTKVVPNE